MEFLEPKKRWRSDGGMNDEMRRRKFKGLTPGAIRVDDGLLEFKRPGMRSCGFSRHRKYYLTKLVVYGGRGSRRLDVDCSTGRKPMERGDEPPPSILLYRVGFGCILKVVA